MMRQRSLWTNPAGWPLVLFFLIGGIAFTIAMPEIFIGQIWIGVAILVGAVFFFIGARGKRAQRIRETGIPATAHILEMTQTGTYVNEQPQVKFKLRIEAPGMTPYEIDKRAVVPLIALGQLSSGQPLSVHINREDANEVEIDWSGGGAAAPMTVSSQSGEAVQVTDPAARQAALDAMRQHGVNPSGGGVDLRSNPAARQAVLEALQKHGVDVAHETAAADPSTAVQPTEGGGADRTLDRLQKLMELKNAQLISDEEFAQHKERILGSI